MKNFDLRNKFTKNESLVNHSSMHVGGNAKYYYEPTNIKELVNVIKFCQKQNLNYYILGNGTNVIFKDGGFDGLIICTKKLSKFKIIKNRIKAECGVNLTTLNLSLISNSLKNMEFSFGIPGSVGGAVVMNAGAFGGEMSDVVYKVKIFDGKKVRVLGKNELKFDYRNSNLKQNNYVVLCVYLKLDYGDKLEIEKKCKENFEKRKNTQPYGTFNCGSFFKTTHNVIPGKMIDNLGLKGATINGAMVSTVHANFIINNKNAKCKDIIELKNMVKQKVFEQTNVLLDEEVIFVGEDE